MTAVDSVPRTTPHAAEVRVRRTIRPLLGVSLTVLALLAASPVSAHPPGVTERVSVGPAAAAGDNDSDLAAISADGRYVAFWSYASTLVAGDTNGTSDVFVHDRATGVTERVSVDSRERESEGGDRDGVLDTNFGRPAITADGRYVAFASSATNLVKGDKNDAVDIFLRDRVLGTTERVTVVGRKTVANAESSHPALSPDGRFVAFQSFADNLVPDDTNFTSDVFVLDRQAGTVARASVTSTGEQATNASASAAISADGRFVVFESGAVLVPGEIEDFASDVYLRDVQAGTTEGISTSRTEFVGQSGAPAITPDGRFVAFQSSDEGLVEGDDNNSYDIFVRDRTTGLLERVSVDSAGVQGDDWSLAPAISDDGRFVAFQSFADNLVAGDGNFDYDVFVRDRVAGTTVRASVRTDGTEGDLSLASFFPSLSADGTVVAFSSEANLVAEDTGFPVDVFVHDEAP
jgi:Tol biopolymer transport system component